MFFTGCLAPCCLGHGDTPGASADPRRYLEPHPVAGCVSSSDPILPQAPAKDGGWQRLLGWGGERAAETPPPWGRLATCMCHRPWQEGCGLLPATPTFHREGGPGTWCPHGLGARSYLKETSFREAPSRAQDVSAVSQSPSSPRASRAKGTPCTWASSEMP